MEANDPPRLRESERDGRVRREVFAALAPKGVYFSTELRWSLGPVVGSMAWWGEAYSRNKAVPAD